MFNAEVFVFLLLILLLFKYLILLRLTLLLLLLLLLVVAVVVGIVPLIIAELFILLLILLFDGIVCIIGFCDDRLFEEIVGADVFNESLETDLRFSKDDCMLAEYFVCWCSGCRTSSAVFIESIEFMELFELIGNNLFWLMA
mgnify:CR=1 FL=1